MGNLTGELFQPVRLHYRVLNHPGLERAFEKLRCLEYDTPRKRWVWLYEHEAKTLQFQRSYAEFPKELRPIVIGAFFLRTEKALLLDLRSCERALLAIPFFDTQLPRNLVKLEDAEVVNQLFPLTKANQQLTPDALFDAQLSTVNDPEALMKDLTDKAVAGRGLAEKLMILMDKLKSRSSKPQPRIERFPVHFAEDGMEGVTLALTLRQIVAREHWLGNSKYTLGDAIKSISKMS